LVNESSFDLYFWGIKKKVDNKKIPVIGVPIVNGVHWMRRLINSVDYPVKELVIFNNNGKGEINQELDEIAKTPHSYIEKITVCHLPANIGCMGAWNMIIKCYMNSPYWIISNHDIAFTPGFLKTMVEKAKDQEVGMVHCSEASWGENLKNEGSFECFLIKDWVVQEYGLFDENLYPAYCDDIDYVLRFKSKPIKRIFSVGVPFLHGEENYSTTGSQTWRTDLSLKDKIDNARIMNECEYINSKWGENWLIKDKQPNKKPFNSFPISYTTYDLNFVRKKHLGF
jgi:GT2 family glycosyltransferase